MATDPAHPLPRIPEFEGEYDLVRELGRGGTAVVYLARDRELGRDVAIKLIHASHLLDENAVARLQREARTVGKLQHPNIIPLLGVRRLEEHGLALVFQYVPGRSLKARLQEEGPLPFDDAESLLRDMAAALAYAHQHRIVHRDVKPENVYLDEGAGIARLADFGIARVWDSDSGLTLPGSAIGTPAYMSPEQVDGLVLDGRSDIYSLGLLGWEALSGRQPWAGETVYNIIYKQKHERLPALTGIRKGIPLNICRALDGALQKRRSDRWETAEEFLKALDDDSEFPGARPSVGRSHTPTSDPFPRHGGHSPSHPGSPGQASASDPASPPEASESEALSEARSPSPDPSDPTTRRKRLIGLIAAGAFVLVLVGMLGILALGGPGGWLDSIAGTLVPPTPPDAGAETVVPTEPGRLTLIQGDGQEGWPASPLEQSVVFRVDDTDGSPLPEVPVRFQVASGGGAVSPARTVTNENGFVAARWTLGPGLGPQSLEARVEDQEETTVTLTARAIEPTPTRIQVLSGSGQQAEDGTALPTPLRVRVVDAGGRGIPGLDLVFEATGEGGQVVPDSTTTDSAGVAEARWTLGPTRGPQEVVARVPTVEGVQATVHAEAVEAGLPPRPGILAGARHTCVLGGDGALRCWGYGGSAPGTPVGAQPFSRIALGGDHACALDRDGQAYCWGGNDHGQLGAGSSTGPAGAVAVRGDLPPLLDIQAGAAHTCALTSGGEIHCWGANVVGQLGDDSHGSRAVPGPVASGLEFASLTTGSHHTCALEPNGRAHCWGSNREGQLGRFATGESLRPRPMGGGHRFRKLTAGEVHTCGLQSNGTLLCWGANDHGQLGRGPSEGGWEPRPVRAEEPFREAVAGARFTCGIGWSGEAYCWGRNEHGQLGDGTRVDRREPVRVEGSFTFSQLHVGREHACGTTSEGDLLCWGRNTDGQLGDGTRTDRSTPVRVGGNDGGS